VISFVADLSANDQLRTAPRRVVRAVTTAALACLGSGRHDRATRPRSAWLRRRASGAFERAGDSAHHRARIELGSHPLSTPVPSSTVASTPRGRRAGADRAFSTIRPAC